MAALQLQRSQFDQELETVRGRYEERLMTQRTQYEDEIRQTRSRYEQDLALLRQQLDRCVPGPARQQDGPAPSGVEFVGAGCTTDPPRWGCGVIA